MEAVGGGPGGDYIGRVALVSVGYGPEKDDDAIGVRASHVHEHTGLLEEDL